MRSFLLASCATLIALTGTACSNNEQAESIEESADTTIEAPANTAIETPRLYVFDCGRIDVLDLAVFDGGGAYDGRQDNFVDTCFMVRHPQGDFVWDAGLPDALNETPDGVTNGPFRVSMPKTFSGQLERLGVPAAEVEYFSISHSHFDHVGNGNLFKDSTFIVHEDERAHMFRDEARADEETFTAFNELENANTITFADSYDVFGDSSVIIISMPGHTPGHSVLLVNLEHTGPVLLVGDLYHLTEAREKKTVPVFNTDAAQTLESMASFEELAAASGARVIIQHEDADFDALPRAPAYMD